MALYRKYRPASFAEVVGQEHVTEPLSVALESGRINHAYLFSGPRGCGKTSSARILARSLNCEQGPTATPCGVCASCVALAPGGPGNLDVTELDAASHGGVDDTRDLRERAFFAPASSRYRVLIIDEAHMVTNAGFNALLKIVEEPPEHLIFVFATTEPEKVLPTIRSRTHHYPFRLLTPTAMRGLVEGVCEREGVSVDPAVLPLVIRAGGGSPRDTLSVLDQLMAGADEGGITYPRAVALLGATEASLIDSSVDALAAGDGASLFRTVDRVVEAGHDPRRFAADLLQRLRDLILVQSVPQAVERGLVDAPGEQAAVLERQAEQFGPATLARCADMVHEGMASMRGATSPRLLLEILCARLLLPAAEGSHEALLQRVEMLERGRPTGGGAAQAGAASVAAGGGGGSVDGSDVGGAGSAGDGPGGAEGAESAAGGGRRFVRRSQQQPAAEVQAADGQASGVQTPGEQAAEAQPADAGAPVPAAGRPQDASATTDVAPGVPRADSAAASAAAAHEAPAHETPGSEAPADGGDEPAAPEPAAPEVAAPESAAPGLPASTPDASRRAAPVRESPARATAPVAEPHADAAPPATVDPAEPGTVGSTGHASESGSESESGPAVQPARGAGPAAAPASTPADRPVAAARSAQATASEPAATASGESAPPADTASPAAASDDGGLGAEDVRRVWNEVRSAVRARTRTVEVMLAGATVAGVEGREIHLVHDYGPLAARLAQPHNASVIAEAVGTVLGGEWAVRSTAAGDGPAPAAGPAPTGGARQRPAAPAREARPAPAEQSGARGETPPPPAERGWERRVREAEQGAPGGGTGRPGGPSGPGRTGGADPYDDVPPPEEPEPEPGEPGAPPPPPVSEDDMIAEARSGPQNRDHRTAEELALQLLREHLGARPVDR